MTPGERIGDRRAAVRFEIIGELWATVLTRQPLPVLNVGLGGLLVESAGPLVVGSLQRLRLTIGEEPSEVSASVRHVTPSQGRPDRYLVGLEFVDLTPRTRDRIDALIADSTVMTGRIGQA